MEISGSATMCAVKQMFTLVYASVVLDPETPIEFAKVLLPNASLSDDKGLVQVQVRRAVPTTFSARQGQWVMDGCGPTTHPPRAACAAGFSLAPTNLPLTMNLPNADTSSGRPSSVTQAGSYLEYLSYLIIPSCLSCVECVIKLLHAKCC